MHRAIVFSAAALMTLAAGQLSAHEGHGKGIDVKHTWVRATAKVAEATPGYAKITNAGKTADRLIAVSLDGAAGGELITAVVEGGGSGQQVATAGLAIEPGTTIELTTAGPHAKFTGLTTTIDADGYVDGSLTFEKAGTIRIVFFVEAAAESAR